MKITRIEHNYKEFSFILTERLTTAKEMYDVMLKLNTEQETQDGEFDKLRQNIYDICEDKDFNIHLSADLLPGRRDIILELHVIISFKQNTELKDIDNELILGTLFKEIKDHFNTYYKTSIRDWETKSKIIKEHFSY